MKTTLKELMQNGICYLVAKGVWVDKDGREYRLNMKNKADEIEFDIIGEACKIAKEDNTKSLFGEE